jgi:hypothetical protein
MISFIHAWEHEGLKHIAPEQMSDFLFILVHWMILREKPRTEMNNGRLEFIIDIAVQSN